MRSEQRRLELHIMLHERLNRQGEESPWTEYCLTPPFDDEDAPTTMGAYLAMYATPDNRLEYTYANVGSPTSEPQLAVAIMSARLPDDAKAALRNADAKSIEDGFAYDGDPTDAEALLRAYVEVAVTRLGDLQLPLGFVALYSTVASPETHLDFYAVTGVPPLQLWQLFRANMTLGLE